MSEELGYISLTDSNNPENSYGFNKKYSEYTAQQIDDAVRKIIQKNHKKTIELLTKHKEQLEEMAKTLLKKEVLTHIDLKEMLGPRPYGSPMEQIYDDAQSKKTSLVAEDDSQEKETTSSNENSVSENGIAEGVDSDNGSTDKSASAS
jgi:cell division protease FtsH